MSAYADIKYTMPPKEGEQERSVDELRSIAMAAGHGHVSIDRHPRLSTGENPWFDLDDNVRAIYDVRFIQTFNPNFVLHLLDRLQQAEQAVEDRNAGSDRGV